MKCRSDGKDWMASLPDDAIVVAYNDRWDPSIRFMAVMYGPHGGLMATTAPSEVEAVERLVNHNGVFGPGALQSRLH